MLPGEVDSHDFIAFTLLNERVLLAMTMTLSPTPAIACIEESCSHSDPEQEMHEEKSKDNPCHCFHASNQLCCPLTSAQNERSNH
jgi:hypothetical protein